MKEKTFQIIVSVVLVLALALGAVALYQVGQPVEYQVMSVSGYLFTLKDGDGTVQFSIDDDGVVDIQGNKMDLDANADTSITADTDDQMDFEIGGADHGSWTPTKLMLNDDLIVDDTLNIDDTDSTITATQTLTPTGTFYEFNPTATLTLTLATGSAEVGDLLILQNLNGSYSVVIVDTGATVGGSNVTLGQNDLALFFYTNSKWVEIASPDNS